MKIYEIGTGYTSIPAQMGAATEIVVEELTKAFLAKGRDVEIIDIASDTRGPHTLPITEVKLPAIFTKTDVSLGLMHKLKRVAYSVALAGKLRRILKESGGKVILHFHNQYNLFFFLKLTPRRLQEKAVIAYTNHSGIWRLPWEEVRDTVRKRYFQEAACMKNADIVFVLNQETKDTVIQHLQVDADRLHIIHNGVNTQLYRPLDDPEKQEAQRALGLEGKQVILQVGSVNENKGQLRTAQRLAPLMKAREDVVFAYIGGIVDEQYQQSILDFAAENRLQGQIRYLGISAPGQALNRVYNAARATVCASRFEGFSLVIIESLACGVPVFLEQAFPFSVGDGCIAYEEDTFSEVAGLLLADSRLTRQISAAARENAVRTYNWDSVAERTLAVFAGIGAE